MNCPDCDWNQPPADVKVEITWHNYATFYSMCPPELFRVVDDCGNERQMTDGEREAFIRGANYGFN
jgi:hypothetical protein